MSGFSRDGDFPLFSMIFYDFCMIFYVLCMNFYDFCVILAAAAAAAVVVAVIRLMVYILIVCFLYDFVRYSLSSPEGFW